MEDKKLYDLILGSAIAYLSYKLRTKKEMTDYVKKKTAESDLIEAVISRIEELGYIDDMAYAKAFIESRNKNKPKGKQFLCIELQRKGIERTVAREMVELYGGSKEMETEVVEALADKKLRALTKYSEKDQQTKLFSFLMRRGFRMDMIKHVIDARFKRK